MGSLGEIGPHKRFPCHIWWAYRKELWGSGTFSRLFVLWGQGWVILFSYFQSWRRCIEIGFGSLWFLSEVFYLTLSGDCKSLLPQKAIWYSCPSKACFKCPMCGLRQNSGQLNLNKEGNFIHYVISVRRMVIQCYISFSLFSGLGHLDISLVWSGTGFHFSATMMDILQQWKGERMSSSETESLRWADLAAICSP